MRKRLALVMAAMTMAASLAACGSSGSSDASGSSAAASSGSTAVSSGSEAASSASEAASSSGDETATTDRFAAAAVKNAQEAADDSVTGDNSDVTIGVSFKTLNEERWQNEAACLEAVAEERGVKLDIQTANQDSDKQISQIENMITQGVDVIIACAVDDGALANVLNDAHDQGIKIVSYDDNFSNTWMDAKVGYDPYDVGKGITKAVDEAAVAGNYGFIYGDKGSGLTVNQFAQGMKDQVQDLIDDGTAVNVMEQYCTDWKAENAMAHVENLISKYGEDIAVVCCMNDGTASGAIQALDAAGMAGKVLVTGMDGELTACQRIAEGTQLSTVFKNPARLSVQAVDVAIKLAHGEEIEGDASLNFGQNDFPWLYTTYDVVTADNLDEIMVDSGIYTHEEVYGE